jgi:L,D-transpeptidase YcbB
VVVGRAYRHQTPVFWSEMKRVIFRPYWNVPLSIQRAELVPKLRGDPTYLTRNNYEIVHSTSDTLIAGTTVNDAVLSQLTSGTLRLRQVPGPRNALGLVKFVFPNNHNVYLHDTPETQLFSRSRRDFSHGCIRVENPEAFAAWVLKHTSRWTIERIREAMHGDNTREVDLDVPIPVLIVYATAIVLSDDQVHFFHDIYGHDAALQTLLSNQTH